jgi:hypothetical protein
MVAGDPVSAVAVELLDLSVAADGTVVGVAPSGAVLHWNPDDREWGPIAGDWPNLVQISVRSAGDLWGLDSAGAVYRGALTVRPEQVAGTLVYISVAADGTVWGVAAGGNAVRYVGDGGTWEDVPAPAPLQRISVGTAVNVVALDQAGHLYTYRGPDGWQTLAGSFKDVSVGHDGSMWAINPGGHVCIYGSETSGWYELPAMLRQISVGSSRHVWGLDADARAVDLTGGNEPFSEARRAHHPAILWDAEDPFDDTRSTHLWIVNMAARLAAADPDPAGRQVCELIQPGKGKIGDPFHDSLCQGLYDADFVDQYRGPMLPPNGWIPSWAGHFYDPDTKKNWQGDERNTAQLNCGQYVMESTSERGWIYFDNDGNARLLPPEKRGPAGYSLGLALHYLTDITQPMHASNFCYQYSHPTFGYHSDVEAYVMTRQAIVQSPDLTPSTNGPLGLGCPKRAPGDYECGDHSACTDFGLYCHVAARNAKDKYAVRLIDQAGSAYWGWPGGGAYWRDNVVEPLIEPMLQDAILITAQFLVGWMQYAKRYLTGAAYGDGWKNPRGYLTCLSAAADGTVWGVNAQMPTTDPEGNVFWWDGSNWGRHNGYLTCIAVGSKSEIWGVNANMGKDQTNIARWNGSTWVSVPGHLTQISVASDGTVWGVNAHQANTTDNIYRWTGNTWERVKGYLTCIAVGSKTEVWGVNAQLPGDQTNIGRWNGSTWDTIGGYLTQIAVAPDGAVLGVNALQFPDVQNIYVWRGKDQPWGGIAGHLTQISPTSATQFWGVNAEQYSYPGIGNPRNVYQYQHA